MKWRTSLEVLSATGVLTATLALAATLVAPAPAAAQTPAAAPTPATAQTPAAAQDHPVGVASYYECDMTREARADEIMLTEMAPVIQQYVESGELLSWHWLEHDLGGKWRRAAIFYAADRATLFRVRTAILEELRSERAEATAEFTDICYTHEDYVWIQLHSSP